LYEKNRTGNEEAPVDESKREFVERFIEATERGDLDALAAMAHEDIIMEWPQSGERFRGRQNALAALRAQETKPEMAGEPRMIGSGDVWVLMTPLRYGDEIHHYVGVYELRDGKIGRATEYFGAPFPAQEFRAEFTDKD
jgi:ketosteroid isomerase-like protein